MLSVRFGEESVVGRDVKLVFEKEEELIEMFTGIVTAIGELSVKKELPML